MWVWLCESDLSVSMWVWVCEGEHVRVSMWVWAFQCECDYVSFSMWVCEYLSVILWVCEREFEYVSLNTWVWVCECVSMWVWPEFEYVSMWVFEYEYVSVSIWVCEREREYVNVSIWVWVCECLKFVSNLRFCLSSFPIWLTKLSDYSFYEQQTMHISFVLVCACANCKQCQATLKLVHLHILFCWANSQTTSSVKKSQHSDM